MPTEEDQSAFSPDELARVIEILDAIASDRGIMVDVPKEQRDALLRVAGRVAHPGRLARRQLRQASRVRQKADVEKTKR